MITPELALVDPDLRAAAIAALPRFEPLELVRRERAQRVLEPDPILELREALAGEAVAEPIASAADSTSTSLVAAAAYLGAILSEAAVVGVAIILIVTSIVLVLNALV